MNFNGDKTGNGLTWEMITNEMSKFGDIKEGDLFELVRKRKKGRKIVFEFKKVDTRF